MSCQFAKAIRDLISCDCLCLVTEEICEEADMEAVKDYLCDIDWYGSFDFSPSVDKKYGTFIVLLQNDSDY
ncbi:hypothetical protein Aduo_018327 [Ancylostoma duodenale]